MHGTLQRKDARQHELSVVWMCDTPMHACMQGMSDLASPLLMVLCGDEAEAFWAFEALMRRLAGNFDADQRGMHAQLEALMGLVQVGADPGVRGGGRRTSDPLLVTAPGNLALRCHR